LIVRKTDFTSDEKSISEQGMDSFVISVNLISESVGTMDLLLSGSGA
jgi:hypothetical protein